MYAEDLVDVLVSTLADQCPEVKKVSAVLVGRLAEHHKKVLRLKGSSLAAPLARNLSHRQSGVRAVTVTGLGQLILSTDGAVFESLASHLAQRVFDPSPAVRLRLVESLGSLLVRMPDRYSYWHKTVPLLLVCFCDDIAEVRVGNIFVSQIFSVKNEIFSGLPAGGETLGRGRGGLAGGEQDERREAEGGARLPPQPEARPLPQLA